VPNLSEKIATNKSVVMAFYAGGVRGDIAAIRSHLHDDFVCSAPSYLPWGGVTPNANGYVDTVLPQVAAVLDFSRFSYDSVTAEDDHVVALINVGVKGTDSMIKISEHWQLEQGMARSIWVAYFEPAALLALIGRNTAAGTKDHP
jgi:ketosteroid isomerase-like protein